MKGMYVIDGEFVQRTQSAWTHTALNGEPDQAPTIACVIRPICDACEASVLGGPPPAKGQTGTYRV